MWNNQDEPTSKQGGRHLAGTGKAKAMSAGGSFYFFEDPDDIALSGTLVAEVDTEESSSHTERILETIDAICSDPNLREPDEAPPSPEAQQAAIKLIEDASEFLAGAMPFGDAAAYWGEISITWRNGTRLARLACFSDGRPPRLDYGISPFGAIGHYKTDRPADFMDLANRIEWLRSAVS